MSAEPVDSFADDGGDDGAGDGLDDDGRGGGERVGGSRRVLRPFVSAGLSTPTGADLLAVLVDLTGRGDLSGREWVEVAAGWKAIGGFCAAGLLTAVGELDRSFNPAGSDAGSDSAAGPGRTCPVRPTADELAPVLGIAPRAASALVALSRRLESLPGAVDALAEGRMDLTQVKILDQVTRDLPRAAATEVEAAAVAWAPRRTAQQLRADLATEAARVDPDHASVAAERGVQERDVSWRPSPLPGCRRLVADLPMVVGTAAWLALNGAAKTAKTAKQGGVRPDGGVEDRTLPQLRADTLTALLTGHTGRTGHTDQQADQHPTRVPTPAQLAALAEVQVVVAADTLTGTSNLPAHLPGTGPLDVGTVRELAGRARWRRLVADPHTGTLTHADHTVHFPPHNDTDTDTPRREAAAEADGAAAGTGSVDPRWLRLFGDPIQPALNDDGTRYRPSTSLRRHVHTRDATCIGPACFQPAASTQLDHTINHGERDSGGVLGATTAANLGSTCERIHNAKTHGGWQLRQPAPGSFIWTSPTGRTYRVTARPLIPGWHRQREGPAP